MTLEELRQYILGVLDKAIGIRDEQRMMANTAKRVGGDLVDIVEILRTLFSDYLDQALRTFDDVEFQKLILRESFKTADFIPGVLGSGTGMVGTEDFTTGKLTVRNYMEVMALAIAQVFWRGGQDVYSPSGMKVNKVEEYADYWRCYMETSKGQKNTCTVGAQMRCNKYGDGKKKYYWNLVTGIGENYIDLSKTDRDGVDVPEVGDELAQFGHRTDPNLSWILVISSMPEDAGMTMYAGVDSYTLSGKWAIRVGRSLDDPTRVGVFTKNGELSDVIAGLEEKIQDAIAKTVDITAPSQVFKYEAAYTGTPTPASILLTALPRNFTPTSYQWQYLSGSAWTDISGATSSTYSVAPGNITLFPPGVYTRTFRCVCNGDANLSDNFTLAKLADGAAGQPGAAGKGVKSTVVSYQGSTSGTTVPSGTWLTSIPPVAAGSYLWSKTEITYTDNSRSTMYSVARMGTNGTNGNAGNGVSGTVVTYQASTSGTTAPTGTWSNTIPPVSAGSFLWTKTVISYTNGTSSTIYSVGKMGSTGAAGKDAYTVLLTNEAHTVACDANGNPLLGELAKAKTKINAYKGTTKLAAVHSGATAGQFYVVSLTSVGGSFQLNGNDEIICTAMNADTASYTCKVYLESTSFYVEKTFIVTKAKSGENYWKTDVWLDASSYDADKWIPFTGTALQRMGYNRICVSVALNSGTKPAWSTHASGFSVDFDFDMQASGWGTTDAQTLIYADTFKFCPESPASCGQMTYSSIPVLYLRGGGKYHVKTDFPVTWTPRPDGYTWTSGSYTQSVSPQTSRPEPIGTSIIGRGVRSVANKYAVSSSNTTAPASWSDTVPSTTTTNRYLWNYEIITYTDGTTAETNKRVIGVHGATGTTGVGIKSIIEYYLASASASGVTTSTSGWTTGMQVTTTTKKYLWNYEIVTYTDNNKYTSTPVIIGTHGATGDKGEPGAAGKGVKSTVVSYQGSTSGTTVPSGTWLTSIPAVAAGSYLWSKTVITYTDNTSSTMYSVSKMGNTGAAGAAGRGVSSTAVTYQASANGTAVPTGTWSIGIPSVAANQYLWTRTVITYTDNTTSTAYSIGKMGATGATGAAGKGVKSTAITYQTSTSGTTVPTGTWNTTIPSVAANSYLWTRTIITYTDNTTSTAYSIGKMGATGATGSAGKGIKSSVITYQASTSGTTAPTGTWSGTIPSVAANQYLWTRTIITYTDNTTSTSYSIGKMGATGSQGIPGESISGKMLYKDPEFKLGWNGVNKYSNSAADVKAKLVVERIAKPSDAPTQSGYCLKVTCKAAQSPGYGGVYQSINSRANAVFIQKIIAKIPEGYNINTASNSMGTGYSDTWLTSTAGTGKYTTYLRKVVCGATGTFSSGGHVYITGNSAPSEAVPLEWYIAFMTCYDQTADGYADLEITTKDSFAAQLGFTNFEALKVNAVTKGALVKAGMINTALLAADALIAVDGFIDKLKTNILKANSISANMLAVAGFSFQDYKVIGGKDFGVGPGVKMTSTDAERSFKAYKDASNYISMFYNGTNDWGLKGVVGGNSVFQLGNPSGGGTFVGPFNFTKTQLMSSSDVVIGSSTYKQGFTLENNKIAFGRAVGSIYQRRAQIGIADNAYGSDTLLAIEGGDIWHQGSVTIPNGSSYTSRPCRFYSNDIMMRGEMKMYENAMLTDHNGNILIKNGKFCAPIKSFSLYGSSMSFTPSSVIYGINTIGSANVNVTINGGTPGQILILMNYAGKSFNIVKSNGALVTRVPAEKSAVLYFDGSNWAGLMVGNFYQV